MQAGCENGLLHQSDRAALRSRLAARFSGGYWSFFSAAACMDFGFGLFVFLFNLYLVDLHFDERTLGRVLACFTLGNVAGTLPGMLVTRRYGVRPLLFVTFCAVPLLSALRVLLVGQTEQYLLAFATGACLCGWPICFSPAIAQLTDTKNRAAGFSLAFAAGIGLGTFAGIAGGYLPAVLQNSAFHLSQVQGIQCVLLGACAFVALGIWPLTRLTLSGTSPEPGRKIRIFHPYLMRFLPPFVLWNVVAGSFPMFGAVYLQRALGIPLQQLGVVFAASQMMQVVAVLCSPMLFRRLGNARGVAVAQLGTAVFLACIAGAHALYAALGFYVLYFAAQFMCSPGIYQLLMERVPEAERSSASALQNLSGALCQAGAAALTGICIVAYGYHVLLVADCCIAALAALLFAWLASADRRADLRSSSDDRTRMEEKQSPDWILPEVAE